MAKEYVHLGHDKDATEHVIDAEFEDISDLQNDIDSQLDSIFEEFGCDPNDMSIKCHVKKLVPDRGETEHCFTFRPSELPIIEKIKKRFGHGEYEIWIYKNRKILKRPKLRIAKELTGDGYYDNNRISSYHDRESESLKMMLEKQGEEITRLRSEVLHGSNTSNSIEMMKNTMAMVKDVMTSTVQPALGLPELMSVMLQMKEFNGSNDDPVSMLMKGMDLAAGMNSLNNSDDNKQDSFLGLASTVIPALIDMGRETQQNSEKSHQPKVEQEGNVNQPNTNKQPNNQENKAVEESIIQNNLNNVMYILGTQAAKGGNIELYAEFIIDNVEDADLDLLIKVPNAIDLLNSNYPFVNNNRGWFERLLAEVKAICLENSTDQKNNDSENDTGSSINNSETTSANDNIK